MKKIILSIISFFCSMPILLAQDYSQSGGAAAHWDAIHAFDDTGGGGMHWGVSLLIGLIVLIGWGIYQSKKEEKEK